MNNKNCLSAQDLLLHYYQELSVTSEESLHLANCSACEERLNSLRIELAALPDLAQEIDPYAGTRMAARVSERLKRPQRKWLPLIGTSAGAVLALVITISFWSPQQELQQTVNHNSSPMALNLDEEMPDIDFIDDLELLKELDLLSQIEGV